MKRCVCLILFCVLHVGSALCLDRQAFTFTSYRLEVQIDRASHVMAVTGKLTLRNDSKLPQKTLALQVSSSLQWNGAAMDDQPLQWLGQTYTSDIDHTGSLSEAIVTLPKEVLPNGSLTLDVQYGGTVTADATRFARIGAPQDLALRNDWDQISEAFTAVRGLGYVVWYPVAIDAVSMSDGTAVSDAIARWKERQANAGFYASISCTADKGLPPRIVINAPGSGLGEFDATQAGDTPPGVVNRFELSSLNGVTPAFAIGQFTKLSRPSIEVLYAPEHDLIAKDYAVAAEASDPLLKDWLPEAPEPIRVIELTDPNATPYQDGATLFAPLRSSTQQNLQLLLLPTQVTARFPSRRPWMQNGLGLFLQAELLRQSSGRAGALRFLDQYQPPLAKAEELANARAEGKTASVHASQSDNPLLNTSDELYLRVKAGFVFWMLRDMLGETALQHSLMAYRPASDPDPTSFQKLLQAETKQNLEWFFDDWVYRDRGLPDFRIESAFPRQMLRGKATSFMVTATIENRGDAGAEVPVLVQTANGEKSSRVLVKAHDKAIARIEVPDAPAKVTVNDGSVPEADTTNNVYTIETKPQP